jgi:hypothetical protein
MIWIALLSIAAIVCVAYTLAVNGAFMRCPHCRKIGAWRFDNVAESMDEIDGDGAVVKSWTRQICRKCGGRVLHTWSDHEGREIRTA